MSEAVGSIEINNSRRLEVRWSLIETHYLDGPSRTIVQHSTFSVYPLSVGGAVAVVKALLGTARRPVDLLELTTDVPATVERRPC